MIKYIYTLFITIFLISTTQAQDSCTYVNNDFEVFLDITEAIHGPNSGLAAGTLIVPEGHTSLLRFLTLSFGSIFITPGSAEWLELWSIGFGLAPNNMASSGNTSLQIGGDENASSADIYSVNYCNIVPDSITMDIMHIGGGMDTLTVFMYQDTTVTALPQDSSEFPNYASYSNFDLIAQGTDADFRQITIPVIGTGNIPDADTMMMLIFVSGNEAFLGTGEESHFLIDNIQIRYGVQAVDNDMDGFTDDVDCNDNDPNVNPDAMEIAYNGIDDDCNPMTPDDDLDMDGFAMADDCDDMNADVNPDAMEIPYNGIDDDCDTMTLDDDLDMDGFAMADDCDDMNADVNPDAMEIPYNGIDDDCDTMTLDDDLDMDGFAMADDCDDMNADINPDAMEIPYNGLDDDCDTMTLDDDLDMDGFAMADDCDDMNADINPDATEIPYNGIDDDCDTMTLDDDLDMDGFVMADDCDDMNAAINPDAMEIPDNGIDEDCDGVDGPSSTADALFRSINIAPNPFRDQLTIKAAFEINRINIFKVDGQLIYDALVNGNNININTQEFKNGLLIVRMTTNDGLVFQKKVVKI